MMAPTGLAAELLHSLVCSNWSSPVLQVARLAAVGSGHAERPLDMLPPLTRHTSPPDISAATEPYIQQVHQVPIDSSVCTCIAMIQQPGGRRRWQALTCSRLQQGISAVSRSPFLPTRLQ